METKEENIPMKILVTGATGRIGSRFVERLLQRHEDVRLLLRRETDAEKYRSRGADVVLGDLHQQAAIEEAVANVDAVVHLAAFFRGNDADLAHTTNEAGTLALAETSIRAGVQRFIFTSTNLVYGPGKGRP